MKFRQLLLIGLSFLTYILLTGCNNEQGNLGEFPNIGVSLSGLNTHVKLYKIDEINSYQFDDILVLGVEVISSEQVEFKFDYGVRLFVYENKKWVEIPNKMNYPSGEFILSPARGDVFKHGQIGVSPDLEKRKEEVTLRLVIKGKVVREGKATDELTAAYIDVKLSPKKKQI